MPTPFTFLLARTVTVQRKTPTQDALGGETDGTWANVSGLTSVRAMAWQKKRNEHVTDFARMDANSEIEWAFEPGADVRNGDRISYGSAYYHVAGVAFDFTNDGLASGPTVVKTFLRKNE